jgi:hypothetical protein
MNEQSTSPTPAQAPSRRQSNRRAALRRAARGGSRVACRKGVLGLGPNIAVALLDVSETGVRLLVKEALKPRQEVEVCLLAPGHVREFKHAGQIVWTVPAADGNHAVGIAFDRQLPYSAVLDLGRLPSQ